MEKREFVKKVSAATVLATLGLTIDGCNPNSIPEPPPEDEEDNWPKVIDLTQSPYQPLLEDQGWIADDQNKLLLLNIGGNILALSNVCTHAGCSKDWDYESQTSLFRCTCHNSLFNSNGGVEQGPATAPLKSYSVEQTDNTITIRK
jgi:cytochrome b6-f complex iron-sulfur subunit